MTHAVGRVVLVVELPGRASVGGIFRNGMTFSRSGPPAPRGTGGRIGFPLLPHTSSGGRALALPGHRPESAGALHTHNPRPGTPPTCGPAGSSSPAPRDLFPCYATKSTTATPQCLQLPLQKFCHDGSGFVAHGERCPPSRWTGASEPKIRTQRTPRTRGPQPVAARSRPRCGRKGVPVPFVEPKRLDSHPGRHGESPCCRRHRRRNAGPTSGSLDICFFPGLLKICSGPATRHSQVSAGAPVRRVDHCDGRPMAGAQILWHMLPGKTRNPDGDREGVRHREIESAELGDRLVDPIGAPGRPGSSAETEALDDQNRFGRVPLDSQCPPEVMVPRHNHVPAAVVAKSCRQRDDGVEGDSIPPTYRLGAQCPRDGGNVVTTRSRAV